MAFRQTFPPMVVPLALVGISVVVGLACWLGAKCEPALSIAIGAAALSLSKTGYDLWDKERERRRRYEESKETIRAKIGVRHDDDDGTTCIYVRLNNCGKVPVPIESVIFHWTSKNGYVCKTDLAFPQDKEKHYRTFLAPHATTPYLFLTDNEQEYGWTLDDEWITKYPTDSYWISVSSFAGEVARIEGKEIEAAFKVGVRV